MRLQNEAENLENHENDFYKSFGNSYVFSFFIADREVIVSNEVLQYDEFNFIADFGGYLGLLLGASLLTIFDETVNIFIVIKEKFCR